MENIRYGKHFKVTFNFKPEVLILDVDGVLTDGKIYYSEQGKIFKVFGSDDHEALSDLNQFLEIHVITADFRGFAISKKRIEEDMNLPLSFVSSRERPDWVENHFRGKSCIYMGDGIYDWKVFEKVGYAIAPANAFSKTLMMANFVTSKKGGEGAVAEACTHILESFLETP